MSDPVRSAYAAALAMLARRELSEAQVRERLARREHEPPAIDEAVTRLKAAGALDDRRVALAAARTEAQVRSRGRARVLQRVRALGIDPELASQAVDEVFAAVDEDALLERALARRLRGPAARITDPALFRRLFQQLVRQGFSPSAVSRTLRSHGRKGPEPEEEQG
ncbi:MAG: RecX family transcriptional regulator [Acidobacteria bacterium]|nr:MAG: RecX family transcriptional regulator [Acidobacteriota bacterium]